MNPNFIDLVDPTVIDLVDEDEDDNMDTELPARRHLIPFDPERVWWQYILVHNNVFKTVLFDPKSVPNPLAMHGIIMNDPDLIDLLWLTWKEADSTEDQVRLSYSGLGGTWCCYRAPKRRDPAEDDPAYVIKSARQYVFWSD